MPHAFLNPDSQVHVQQRCTKVAFPSRSVAMKAVRTARNPNRPDRARRGHTEGLPLRHLQTMASRASDEARQEEVESPHQADAEPTR